MKIDEIINIIKEKFNKEVIIGTHPW